MALDRNLAHRDKFVFKLIQDLPGGCEGDEIVFPDNDTPVKFLVEMSLSETTKLLSALMTGADLSYPNEAHEVVWIWLRQLECPVSLCDELTSCLAPLFEALSEQMTALQAGTNEIVEQLFENVPVAPSGIEVAGAGNICSGASFVVEFMDYEIRRVYQEAEDGLIDNLIEATVEILRAMPVIESLPVDEIVNIPNQMFANQVADYITDYDTVHDDLVGALSCFIEGNGDVFDIDVWARWLEFIGAEYPTNRAAQLFAAFSPLRQSYINDILAGVFNRPTLRQWFELIMVEYLAGTQGSIACPTYTCPTPVCVTPAIITVPWEILGTMPYGDLLTDEGSCYHEVTTSAATDNPGAFKAGLQAADGQSFTIEDITYPDGILTGTIVYRKNGVDYVAAGTPAFIDGITYFGIGMAAAVPNPRVKAKFTRLG